jgi:hypothetical protein
MLNLRVTYFFLMTISLVAYRESAQADVSDSQRTVEFKAAAAEIPALLLRHGINRVDQLKIQDLMMASGKSQSVNIRFEPWVDVKDGKGHTRVWTRWQRQGPLRQVTVNRELWDKSSADIRRMVALDGMLSAIGFHDENYEASISLWFLTLDEPKQILTPSQYRFAQQISQDAIRFEDTSGSGAGDWGGLFYKMEMVEAAEKKYANDPTPEKQTALLTAFRVALLVQIEITWQKRP